jgi:small subunit ribosomal protein S6
MYIAHPALEGGRLKDLILSIEKSMDQLGGKTCTIDVWGKKKLAYAINKEKYGMYILFQFQNDGSTNKEFNLGLEHNPNILAYLTTRVDEQDILKDISSLDIQLGLSKPEDTKEEPTEEPTELKIEETSNDNSEDSNTSKEAAKEIEEPSKNSESTSDETPVDDSDDNEKEEK